MWELPLFDAFLQVTENIHLKQCIMDSWCWKYDVDNGYTVKEAYKAQLKPVGIQDKEIFSRIWNAYAPSKVMALGWRVMRMRLPTLDNLARRGVIQDVGTNGTCKFCCKEVESVNHLFFGCNFSYDVWSMCLHWLGVFGPLPIQGPSHCICFEHWGGTKKRI